MTLVYIALAGAAGSVARYLLAQGVQRVVASHTQVPVGTLAVNVIGAFAIGVVMAVFAARGELDSRVRIAISVGFLGGFTTYSAFAYETVTLLESDRVGTAALYVAATLFVAGAAAFGGILVGRAIG